MSANQQPIRVLVVDDSVVARQLISQALDRHPEIDVLDTATNGRIALQKIGRLNPDLVILDIEMPEMDGLEALKQIKKDRPALPVIMYSSLTGHSSQKVLEAFTLGAEDCVAKPSSFKDKEEGMRRIEESLASKIIGLCRIGTSRPRMATPARRTEPQKRKKNHPIEVVAIGVSTGGPNALAELMPAFPADFSVPIVIVQHMPPVFTKTLAQRLNSVSALNIVEASPGDVLKPGTALIAPGGFHMALKKNMPTVEIITNKDPLEEGCRPAVNVLFRSVANIYGMSALAVILTGMGKDGLDGSTHIINAGGTLLAQDENSSVVWGMPGAVSRAGLPEKILPLNAIGPEIIRRVNKAAFAL